jgi:hypothetical protein
MNCKEVQSYLAEFVYDDLASATAAKVIEHLQSCVACRQEHAALLHVRQMLDGAAETSPLVDLPGIYRRAAEMERRRFGSWRRVAIAVAGAAAVFLLGALVLRMELRLDANQLVIRWGAMPDLPQKTAPGAPRFVDGPSSPAETQNQLLILGELVQGLTQQEEMRERQREEDRAWFLAQIGNLRRQTAQQWMATERDVAALCSTQLNQTQKGASR